MEGDEINDRKLNADTAEEVLPTSGSSTPPKTSGTELLTEVYAFIFPHSFQHSLTSTRLILVALYGPLKAGHLNGGKQLNRPLTAKEIDTMCDQIEEEDVVSIYTNHLRGKSITNREQLDILRQATLPFNVQKGKARFPQLTSEDFDRMFSRHKDDIDFHRFQSIVQRYRANRIESARRGKDVHAAPSNKLLKDSIRSLTTATMSTSIVRRVSKLPSSRQQFKIIDTTQCPSNESLSANIKLVRQSERDLLLDGDPHQLAEECAWNGLSVLKGSGHGSFVNDAGRGSARRKYTLY